LPGSDRALLRDNLTAIMREAGELALTTFKGASLKSWTKAYSSPVSEADIAVNDLLRTRLTAAAPQAAWLSEETEDDLARTSAASVWIVDPIDGTRAYIAGRSDWTIAVALAERGRPALAAVYAPVSGEMFLASAGGGATLNGYPLKASGGGELAGARIAAPERYLKRLAHLSPQVAPQPKVHSLALRFARVAQGELDAAFASHNSNDWDLAAADLLVHEAGGALTDFTGHILTYNGPHSRHGALIAAGSARHETLIDLVCDRQSEFA